MTDLIPEQQITPQLLKKVSPDVTEEKVMAKRVGASKIKDMMDKALAMAANAIGGTFSSRVKNTDTIQQKVTQKRLEGRTDYSLDDVNDILGLRLIVNSPKDYPKAEEQVKEMSKQGLFNIKKREDVKTGTYHAVHFDTRALNGTPMEIQIHTKQSEAESLANHQIRAEYGEKPEGIVKALRDKQADMVKDLHPDRAKALSHAITTLNEQNGGSIPHTHMAHLVKQAAT